MERHVHPGTGTRPLLVLAHLAHLQGRLHEVPAALLERLRALLDGLPPDDPAREALEPNVNSLERTIGRTAPS